MIYLCIPTHDEEQTVGVVLWKLRQVLAELDRDYQLLVADDASTDRTPEVLEPYTRVLPLTVYRNAERRGYAASLEMLLREAARRSDYPRRDSVIVLQADFTEEPAHVATLVKRLESGADVVASTSLPARSAPVAVRWRRPILNGLLRGMNWPDEVRDPLTGFNAYRVFCLRNALDARKGERLLRAEGWAANAELLLAALPHARRVEGVELQRHAERLQRASRFHFAQTLRQVLALRRGRAPENLLPADALTPASVLGGPSHQRSLIAESLREPAARGRRQATRSTNGAARSPEERKRRPPRKRSRGGRPRDEAGPAKRSRDPSSGRNADAEAAPPEAAATTNQAADAEENGAPAEKKSRRRRAGRRGGKRRGRGRSAPQAESQSPDAPAEPDSGDRQPPFEPTSKAS